MLVWRFDFVDCWGCWVAVSWVAVSWVWVRWGTLLIHLVCRCDFLCSKAVVQFVCLDVCVVFCFVLFFVFVNGNGGA